MRFEFWHQFPGHHHVRTRASHDFTASTSALWFGAHPTASRGRKKMKERLRSSSTVTPKEARDQSKAWCRDERLSSGAHEQDFEHRDPIASGLRLRYPGSSPACGQASTAETCKLVGRNPDLRGWLLHAGSQPPVDLCILPLLEIMPNVSFIVSPGGKPQRYASLASV